MTCTQLHHFRSISTENFEAVLFLNSQTTEVKETRGRPFVEILQDSIVICKLILSTCTPCDALIVVLNK